MTSVLHSHAEDLIIKQVCFHYRFGLTLPSLNSIELSLWRDQTPIHSHHIEGNKLSSANFDVTQRTTVNLLLITEVYNKCS